MGTTKLTRSITRLPRANHSLIPVDAGQVYDFRLSSALRSVASDTPTMLYVGENCFTIILAASHSPITYLHAREILGVVGEPRMWRLKRTRSESRKLTAS